MGIIKKLVIMVSALVIVGGIVAAIVVLTWPAAPMIPSSHVDRATCFTCHETGTSGAPQFPSSHLEKIEKGNFPNDINNCLKCHELEQS